MREACQTYINGRWAEPTTDNQLQRENPANTGEIVCSFPDSGPEDVADAVKAAADAFESWRFVPAPRRAEMLFRAAETMAAHKEALAGHVTLETGRLLKEPRS